MKRTTIAVSFLLSGLLLSFSACKKEGATKAPATPEKKETIAVENGRLVFKTHNDYYKYIAEVKPKTADKAGFTSLFTALQKGYKKTDKDPGLSATLTDLHQSNFPIGFQATLNEKGEVKIGDDIIWYHNDKKYFIHATDEATLATIKEKPEQIKKTIPTVASKLTNARTDIGLRDWNARHQFEFQPQNDAGQNLTGSTRKFVHEIYTRFDGYYDAYPGIKGFQAFIYLRMKMEWRGCCDWNPNASEPRVISVDINGSATLPGISTPFGNYMQGPNFSYNYQYTINYPEELLLVSYNGIGALTNNSWSVEINGTISSHFVGDKLSNKWINTGVLW
jgi:hypothetical protein